MRRINAKFSPPRLRLKTFRELRGVLVMILKTDAACARALDISRHTWVKWNDEPPTWAYWNEVMITVIRLMLPNLKAQIKRTDTDDDKRLTRIRQRFAEALNDYTELDDVDHDIVEHTGAERHVARLLAKQGMFWDVMILPAHAGGYSPRSLRKAARALGCTFTTQGFGEDKQTFVEWPEQPYEGPDVVVHDTKRTEGFGQHHKPKRKIR